MFDFFGNDTDRPHGDVLNFSTLQKARKDLIGEIQAIIDYDDHIHGEGIDLARETWIDIKNEELVHVGELLALLGHLDRSQIGYVEKGVKEFNERLK